MKRIIVSIIVLVCVTVLSSSHANVYDHSGDGSRGITSPKNNIALAVGPTVAAPDPTGKTVDVLSIYSGTFNDVVGTNFYPFWGQSTVVTQVQVGGNDVLQLENFNYQGVELGSAQDVTGMEYIHLDIWSADATTFKIGLISPGPATVEVTLDVTNDSWVGYDIPLSDFAGAVDLTDVFQLIFSDNDTGEAATVYIDNIYFYRAATPDEADAYLTNLTVDGTTIPAFNPNVFSYEVELPVGTTSAPTVAATKSVATATATVSPAAAIPGVTSVTVVSEDGNATNVYEINFHAKAFANLALNKPATASSALQAASNAVDENPGTRWESEFSDPQWIYIDLEANYNLTGVYLSWEGAFAQTYEIQVSGDAQSWSTIYTETSGTGGEEEVELAGIGRYVRMYGTVRGTPYGYSLWEFEVYGTAATNENDATLSALNVDGVLVDQFSASKLAYTVNLSETDTEVPTVTATATQGNATVQITEATALPGTTTVLVTAEDGQTQLRYTVDFVLIGGNEPAIAAPTPVASEVDVISIFSDSYTDVAGTNFYTNWNQSTVVSQTEINGNQTFKFDNFNYQGVELGGEIDVSGMEYLHIDIWTSTASTLTFGMISPGPKEGVANLPITKSAWVGYNIPLADYSSVVDLTEIFQFVFSDGDTGEGATIYLDNIYFYRSETSPESEAFLTNLTVDGETVPEFNANKFKYQYQVALGATEIPTVAATASNQNATVAITPTTTLPGTTTVTVTSEDASATNTYEVEFVLLAVPTEAAPTPASRNAGDVVSIFSGAFENEEGTNFYPNWSQTTKVSEILIEDDMVLKYADFNYQGVELQGSINVSTMDYLHIDLWTSNASQVNLSLISPGPAEIPVALPIVNSEWKSYDIPLADYESVVDLSSVFQFKFDDAGAGDQPTLYISNLYFYRGTPSLSNDASLTEISLDGNPIAGFEPSVLNYTVELASNTTMVPTLSALTSDENAAVTITPAAQLPGTTTVEVVAQDGETSKTYSVEFTLLSPQSDATLQSITVGGEEIDAFSFLQLHYLFDAGSATDAPTVVATPSHTAAQVEVTAAAELPGSTIIKVVSEDQTNTHYYTIFFKTDNLLWWDEFSDTEINTDFWSYEIGDGCDTGLCGWGNGELQAYREANVYVDQIPGEEGNTAMVIKAESTGSNSFTSGRVKTQNKVDVKYGLVEFRVKVPDLETGLWPALWLLGSNNEQVGWPRSGEIDVMEMGQRASFRAEQGHSNVTENNYVGSNIIWYASAACVEGNPTCAASIATDPGYNKPYASATPMNTRFQIYRMYWSPDAIRLTVEDDGVERDLYESPFGTTTSELRDTFNKDFFMVMNMAVGGNFTDATVSSEVTAPIPAYMLIDYARVYSLNGEGTVTLNKVDTAVEPETDEEVPTSVRLMQNYPNPFNPTTQISFEVTSTSHVQLTVSDMLGRSVAVLENGRKNAGFYDLTFDASQLSSGVYLYSLFINGKLEQTKKMLLIK